MKQFQKEVDKWTGRTDLSEHMQRIIDKCYKRDNDRYKKKE